MATIRETDRRSGARGHDHLVHSIYRVRQKGSPEIFFALFSAIFSNLECTYVSQIQSGCAAQRIVTCCSGIVVTVHQAMANEDEQQKQQQHAATAAKGEKEKEELPCLIRHFSLITRAAAVIVISGENTDTMHAARF